MDDDTNDNGRYKVGKAPPDFVFNEAFQVKDWSDFSIDEGIQNTPRHQLFPVFGKTLERPISDLVIPEVQEDLLMKSIRSAKIQYAKLKERAVKRFGCDSRSFSKFRDSWLLGDVCKVLTGRHYAEYRFLKSVLFQKEVDGVDTYIGAIRYHIMHSLALSARIDRKGEAFSCGALDQLIRFSLAATRNNEKGDSIKVPLAFGGGVSNMALRVICLANPVIFLSTSDESEKPFFTMKEASDRWPRAYMFEHEVSPEDLADFSWEKHSMSESLASKVLDHRLRAKLVDAVIQESDYNIKKNERLRAERESELRDTDDYTEEE